MLTPEYDRQDQEKECESDRRQKTLDDTVL